MSLGVAVSQKNRRKMSDGRYVADLAALFERRRIDLGEPHVCEQFEILLTTSDSFRGQLFTLCTAISHMSEEDRTGDELLDMIARALRTEPQDGTALPAALKQSFLSGFDAWTNRGASGEDEWPPRKKPVASVFHTPNTGSDAPAATRRIQAMDSASESPSSSPSGQPVRPSGIPTLQEALEMARIRGGNVPLRPEVIADTPAASEAAAHADASSAPDANSSAIQELNTLLLEIEERMKRLRPQLATTDTPVASAPPVEPAVNRLAALGLLKPEVLSPAAPVAMPEVLSPAMPFGMPQPFSEERDDAFLARHPYMMSKRPVPVIDTLEPEPVESNTAEVSALTPIVAKPQVEPELRLVQRNIVDLEPVSERHQPGPPALVVPDSLRLKAYVAFAVLAGIVLVGTPFSAVVAYRYMHPLYIYDQAKPQPAPVTVAPPVDPNAARPANGGRSSQAKRKGQAARHKPPVAVWPAQ
jgi:hypothetical protein